MTLPIETHPAGLTHPVTHHPVDAIAGPLAAWADRLTAVLGEGADEPTEADGLDGDLTNVVGPSKSDGTANPQATCSTLGLPDPTFWPSLADTDDAAAIVAAADAALGTPWPRPRASDFARFWLDGDRASYEADVFASSSRLSIAALAAAIAPSPARLAEVVDGVGSLCERTTWCWPAHDDVHDRFGRVTPDPDSPFLDLGAGEAAALLAWVDALLRDQLEGSYPGMRERIRREARLRVIDPFLDRTDWHWLGIATTPHNWLAWICQNVVTVALALEPDPIRRERVVRRAVAGLDRYLASLPADGAIDEGVSYWWAGACRALEALDVLHVASDGVLDAAAVPHIRELIAFPHRMQLAPRWWVSFSDASPRLDPTHDGQPWHVLRRWAVRMNDDDALSFASAARRAQGGRALDLTAPPPGFGLGRMIGALLDASAEGPRATREDGRALEDADMAGMAGVEASRWPLLPRVWLPSTQVLVMRESAGSPDGLAVVVKGGHNGEAHNHLDVGSVSVALDGEPVVVDLGRATYTATTFSQQRYSEWHIGSAWHSVPAPGGSGQLVGSEAAARVIALDDDAIALDLTAVYPGSQQWQREVLFARAAAPGDATPGDRSDASAATCVVVDTWGDGESTTLEAADLDSTANCEVVWVLAGQVRLTDGGGSASAIATPGTIVTPDAIAAPGTRRRHLAPLRNVWVSWSSRGSDAVAARLEVRELTDPYLRAAWGDHVTRLVLTVPSTAGQLVTTFAPDQDR